ncbi:hypothetical protein SASPL_149303 [Salvia splendens]|uniref:Starch synthase, chloroplastic/amyloplastic n=1 Tax=Salvia splendens TaxID=180675 RepID=A0A8X8Z546_SALSN|nr:hypothetical protein SASPL_149303 [Salvia splendens]
MEALRIAPSRYPAAKLIQNSGISCFRQLGFASFSSGKRKDRSFCVRARSYKEESEFVSRGSGNAKNQETKEGVLVGDERDEIDSVVGFHSIPHSVKCYDYSGKMIAVYVVVFGCLLLIHLDKALFLSDSKNYDVHNVNCYINERVSETQEDETENLSEEIKSSAKTSPSTTYNVVFVTSEAAPYSKTGGLGDVCGSLPIALAARGHRVMVVSPRYMDGGLSDKKFANAVDTERPTKIHCFGGVQEVGLFHEYRAGVDWVFVDHPSYHRPGTPYGDGFGAFGDNQGVEPAVTYKNFGLPPGWYKALEWVFPTWARTHALDPGEAVNVLKSAIVTADRIVTVSQGYAWEITTPDGGYGLHDLLSSRKSVLTVDDSPQIGFIGRLDYQKGVDILLSAAPHVMYDDVQLVMLGSGEKQYEDWMRQLESTFKDKYRGWVGFNVPISHRITAGCDILVMPSRFEPCGLNQLYAMRYGTVPVVHSTGGLRDTVQNFDPYAKEGAGEGTGYSLVDRKSGDGLEMPLEHEFESWSSAEAAVSDFKSAKMDGTGCDAAASNAASTEEELSVGDEYDVVRLPRWSEANPLEETAADQR